MLKCIVLTLLSERFSILWKNRKVFSDNLSGYTCDKLEWHYISYQNKCKHYENNWINKKTKIRWEDTDHIPLLNNLWKVLKIKWGTLSPIYLFRLLF